jgi:putative glutamine amidotransferase
MPIDARPVVAIITACDVAAQHPFRGHRRVALEEDYHRSIVAAGGVPILLPPTTDTALLTHQLDLADALVLAGGEDVDPLLYGESPLIGTQMPNPVRDAYEWAALEVALDLDLPVLAIGRGLQLLNAWLGGTLHQDNAAAGSNLRHAGTGAPQHGSHEITIEPGSFLEAALGRRRALVNSFHHQSVAHLGDGLTVVARAPDGIVEAVELAGGAAVVGVQWRPELMSRTDADAQSLFRWFVAQASAPPLPPRRALGGATRFIPS